MEELKKIKKYNNIYFRYSFETFIGDIARIIIHASCKICQGAFVCIFKN